MPDKEKVCNHPHHLVCAQIREQAACIDSIERRLGYTYKSTDAQNRVRAQEMLDDIRALREKYG